MEDGSAAPAHEPLTASFAAVSESSDDTASERSQHATPAERLAYLLEEPYLYTHLSGLEYLVMVSQLRGLPHRKASERS